MFRSNCPFRYEGDEKVCTACHRRWDVDEVGDACPPRRHIARARDRMAEHAAFSGATLVSGPSSVVCASRLPPRVPEGAIAGPTLLEKLHVHAGVRVLYDSILPVNGTLHLWPGKLSLSLAAHIIDAAVVTVVLPRPESAGYAADEEHIAAKAVLTASGTTVEYVE